MERSHRCRFAHAGLRNRQNYFNYINLASSDNSGMLRFLTEELQDAEDAGERGR